MVRSGNHSCSIHHAVCPINSGPLFPSVRAPVKRTVDHLLIAEYFFHHVTTAALRPPINRTRDRKARPTMFKPALRLPVPGARPQKRKFRKFRPRVRILFENRKYIVKTVSDGDELEKALQLRYDVFYEEILHKHKLRRIDKDGLDLKCDHMVIVERESGTFVGTYRLICSLFTRKFYSAKEFAIKDVLKLPGVKLELGRACIHKDYRNAMLIAMLWKGISEYIKATDARYLFGCSSIKTMDADQIASVYLYLKQNLQLNDSLKVRPRGRFRIRKFAANLAAYENEGRPAADTKSELLPPLLKSYLKAGAVVCGFPALDKSFRCVDFFTLMNISAVDEKYDKKFLKQ